MGLRDLAYDVARLPNYSKAERMLWPTSRNKLFFSSFFSFRKLQNCDSACISPAEWFEAAPKGMKRNNKFKFRLAEK
jgi:hypothetical protein